MIPEQKLDWSRLVLALCAKERGIMPWTTATTIMGALCRGPEDTAVAQVANLLGQLGYGHGTLGATNAIGLDGVFSNREAIWAYSAAARAAERHIGIPIGAPVRSAAGAGTEMAIYEKAALALADVASGSGWVSGAGCLVHVVINTMSYVQRHVTDKIRYHNYDQVH